MTYDQFLTRITYDQFLTRITQGQLKYIANGHELNITSGKLMLDL